MSFEWPVLTVEQLILQGIIAVPMDGNHGEIHPKSSDFVKSGIPFVMTSDLSNGLVNFDNCAFITEIQAKKLRKGFSKDGDVLLSHKATIGRTAIVKNSGFDFIVLTPQVTYYRILNKLKLDNLYLKYYFDSEPFQSLLANWAGAGSTRAYIGITAQRKLPIVCPPIDIQNDISSILEPIDNRISLLRETNSTLEAIAKTIFKSWFVDFDPVKANAANVGAVREPPLHEPPLHESSLLQQSGIFNLPADVAALFPREFEESAMGLIPKGWKCSTLAEAYKINPQRKLKKGEIAPYLDMANVSTNGHVVTEVIQREMGSGTKFKNGDTLLARITPCLENGKTAFVDFLESDGTGWGSTEFVVLRPKAPLPEYHGYLLARYPTFREFAIQSMSGTSGRQRIQNDVLGRYLLALPSNEIAMAFGNIVECIQQKIAENHNQSRVLEAVRDTLLPRLISGQLRLNQAQDLVDKVTV